LALPQAKPMKDQAKIRQCEIEDVEHPGNIFIIDPSPNMNGPAIAKG